MVPKSYAWDIKAVPAFFFTKKARVRGENACPGCYPLYMPMFCSEYQALCNIHILDIPLMVLLSQEGHACMRSEGSSGTEYTELYIL